MRSQGDELVPTDAGTPGAYATVSGDTSGVHLDEELARRAGLPGTILHGMYLLGVATRVASTVYGEDPTRYAGTRARFVHPGKPGEPLAISWSDVRADEESMVHVEVAQGGRTLLEDVSVRYRIHG